MENNGVVQMRRKPNRKPLSDISNNAVRSSLRPESSSKLNAWPTSLREFGSCSNAGVADPPVTNRVKSKSNTKSNPNRNAGPNPSNNNISNSIASCSDTNHSSCSTPAPNNPQSVLNIGEKNSEIKQLTTYRSRKSCTNQLETNTERRETGTSETQVLTKRRKTGTNETEIVKESRETGTSGLQTENSKKRKTGTSGLEINTTKKGKTCTNEPHLTGASSCPPIQKNMPKMGEKSANRKRRLVSSAPAKKRQKAVEWPKDFVEKQREYFAEVDAEELLEETDSD